MSKAAIIGAVTLVFLGGYLVFVSEDEAQKLMDEDTQTQVEPGSSGYEAENLGDGSWGPNKDNGEPIVYQKDKILDYGQFTVQYDVWFKYARVGGDDTMVLRDAPSVRGTRFVSKDGSIELTVVEGIASLSRDGEVYASGELQNREEIKALGLTSCLDISEEPIAGC